MKIRYVEQAPAAEVTHKIVRNPDYPGEPTGHPRGYNAILIPAITRKPGFFAALKDSIAKDGVRNPVILQQCPNGLCLQFGGSRLRTVQELGLPTIKAIVVDWTGRWSDCPEVTPDNWRTFFTDVPQTVEFTDEGIEQHYNLERNRRSSFDSAGLAWVDGEPGWLRKEFSWIPSGHKGS